MKLDMHWFTVIDFLIFVWELVLYKGRTKFTLKLFACLFWTRQWGRRLNIDIENKVFPFLVGLLTHFYAGDAGLYPSLWTMQMDLAESLIG